MASSLRLTFLGLIALMLAMPAWSQPLPSISPELKLPRGDSGLERVWQRMDTLIYEGRGSLNIVHLGGSHIQAGMLTDAVRRAIHDFAPGVQGKQRALF